MDGSFVTDTETTVVELGTNIILTNALSINPITNLTLDLKGNTIDGETNSKDVVIYYGRNVFSGSLNIKDSSEGKTGAIKSYNAIKISNGNLDSDSTKNYSLTIEGGKYYTYSTYGIIFELNSSTYYMKDKKITLDFQIKDGHFETSDNQAVLFNASSINANNVTLNVNYDKLTFKGLQGRLITSDIDFTVNNVVSTDSNIKLKSSVYDGEYPLEDRNLSASEYGGLWNVVNDYNVIEITKSDGFDVSNVTLNGTYDYTTLPEGAISIKNRGTNSLKIKTVSVKTNGTDEEKFEIVGSETVPTLTAGTTDNTSYKVKAKPGLNAGTYTATITVTDENDKTYTSTVTLTVGRKPLGDISVSKAGWTYDGTAHTGYTKSGLDSVPSDKYLIEYSIKNADEWSTTVPKTAGTYTIRLTITDSNLEEKSAESDFTTEKNNTQIKIIANSDEVTYDSLTHSDSSYKIYYGDTEITTGTLPTGDSISASITGSVIDVKDTVTGNNVVSSYSLENEDSYSNITTTNGTLTVKPITTPIIVTAGSDTKAYDGSALTKNSFTYTDGVILAGDTLKVVTKGSQTFVGTSDNEVSTEPLGVTVWRGEKNITSNYRFGTHINGTLTVEAASQTPTIATQYVVKGNVKTIDDLKASSKWYRR